MGLHCLLKGQLYLSFGRHVIASVVVVCTDCFNTAELYILRIQRIYVPQDIRVSYPWTNNLCNGDEVCFLRSRKWFLKQYLLSSFGSSSLHWNCSQLGTRYRSGWGAMLQAGRSRVRGPMRWINFFGLPNPSSRTRPWASNRNKYQKQKNNVTGE
jgi:hypothetical protein